VIIIATKRQCVRRKSRFTARRRAVLHANAKKGGTVMESRAFPKSTNAKLTRINVHQRRHVSINMPDMTVNVTKVILKILKWTLKSKTNCRQKWIIFLRIFKDMSETVINVAFPSTNAKMKHTIVTITPDVLTYQTVTNANAMQHR